MVNELQPRATWIVRELALAIEDPAGTEELRLAKALLALGRACPAYMRRQFTAELEEQSSRMKANIHEQKKPKQG